MNNFIIVSHKFLTQPDDELVAFLNKKKKENVLHICHSFSDAPDRRSFYTWYKKGKIYKEEKTHDFRSIFESFLYFKEWYFTTKWIIGTNTKWDVYIGMDGMCVLFGNILKLTKLIKKTVFWAIDFVPSHRFSSKVKNYIYHRINIHGYIYSDEMWDLSPRMAVARKKFLNIHTKTYRFHRVVPYGMWVNRIRTYEFNDCDQNTIVFMGHLIEKQGVQLLIQSLPELLEKNSKILLKIIGDGNYKETLIGLAKKNGVDKNCLFLGKIPDHKDVEKEIAKSSVALAPYIKKLDKWTYYADPGKVKTYLACGVPVLLTNIPWNTKEIIENKCGMILEESTKSIVTKVLQLMDSKLNQHYRTNAISYAERFSYDSIFEGLHL